MPIKVACHCGQSFMAKDELRGQTLLCPKCHQPLTIGEGQHESRHSHNGGMADLFEEAGITAAEGPRCPRCLGALKENAVICVECGYNLTTGEQAQAARVRKSGERGHGEAAEVLLERAAYTIQDDEIEEQKNRSQGLPAWMYFVALCCMLGFSFSMLMIPKEQAFFITGNVIMGFAGLYYVYVCIRILIVSFYENVTQGLLCLFVPLYVLYYIFTRWDQCGGYFIMGLGALFVGSLGGVVVSIAPMMAVKKGTTVMNWPPEHCVVVAASSEFLNSQIGLTR